MACIKWSQPILNSFRRDAIPARHLSQRSLSENLRIDPFFSPLPNHTLWKSWPVAHLSCIGWVQTGGALTFCACSTPSKFVSFWPSHPFYSLCVCLILLYVLVGVYLLWREGCVGFWAHVLCLLLLLGMLLVQKPSSSCWAHAFLFYDQGAFWLLILPYYFIVSAIALPFFPYGLAG